MRKKEKMYYLVGESYNAAIRMLTKKGFYVNEYISEELSNNLAAVPVVDYTNKSVGILPLEIYDKNSPMRDDEKFQYLYNLCGTFEDFKKDLKEC